MTFHVEHVDDSFAALKRFAVAGERVDVILTDPPYSPHVQANLCSGSLVGTKNVPKYELAFPALQAGVAGYAWLEDALAVARRWVISFCDVEAFGLIKTVYPDEYVRGGIWYKPNAMGQLTADRPATAYEGVACLHKRKLKPISRKRFFEIGRDIPDYDGPDKAQYVERLALANREFEARPRTRWNGRGSYGIWRCNGTRGKKGRHPNEKPIDLALKLVALFSDRGETVLDPFCGSGALGEACVRLGRNYIGLDNDPEWAEKARSRLQRVDAMGSHGGMTDEQALALCSMKGEDPPAAAAAAAGEDAA